MVSQASKDSARSWYIAHSSAFKESNTLNFISSDKCTCKIGHNRNEGKEIHLNTELLKLILIFEEEEKSFQE